MSDAASKLYDLLADADGLEDGPARIALLEEAVRYADSHCSLDDAFEMRQRLIQAATFGGFREKALVAFSWCLAESDKDPQRFPVEDLIWKYKWVLGGITAFPQISRRQIEQMQDDMEQRLRRLDASLRTIHYLRGRNARDMGDTELAREYFGQWLAARRDRFADCRACECNTHVNWLIHIGEDETALTRAGPILTGRLSCAVIPEATLGSVLRPLVRLGRLDEARRHHRRGYPLVAGQPSYLSTQAKHLLFFTREGELDKGLRLFDESIRWAAGTADLGDKLVFYVAAAALLHVIGKYPGRRKLRVPVCLSVHRKDDSYRPGELSAWFRQQSGLLSARFDERNGNSDSSRRAEEDYRWALGDD